MTSGTESTSTRPCASRRKGGWCTGESPLPLLSFGSDIVRCLIFRALQLKRRSYIADVIAAPVTKRKAGVTRHGRERFVLKHAQLTQGLNHHRRPRSMVVAVLDLQGQTKAVGPIAARQNSHRINAFCANFGNQSSGRGAHY